MSNATASRSVRVFLADDAAPIRQRIAAMLPSAMTVVGEAATPQSCIDGILRTHPDVVVLDIQLEGGQGIEVLRSVRAADPAIAFVVLSNNSLPAYRKRYLEAGAAGFLDKSSEFDQLSAAIAAIPLPESRTAPGASA